MHMKNKQLDPSFVSTSWCVGALLSLAFSSACSDNADPTPDASTTSASTTGETTSFGATTGGETSSVSTSVGGASSAVGPSTTGASTSTGGSTMLGSTTAGTSGANGGTTGNGGMGGSSTGGAGGMATTANGGSAGMESGAGGTGGTSSTGKPPPDPSAGCGKANPQVGSSNSPLNVSNHQYYVKLPANYDASTPYPVLFMFNPTNNPLNWAEQNAGFESNGAKDAAIRVYPGPLSMASGWGASDVSFFDPLYNEITNNFCVDQARMFAAGESSGGDFSSILGCEFGDKLRAVAPCSTKDVGGYPLNVSQRMCKGEVTAVVIHGKNDNVVGPENGPKTRDFYVELNHCGDMTEPVDGYTDTLSNCVQYQGCDEGYPVFWCQHTDPEYSGTNHGWPHFAPDMLWDLFSSY